MRNLNQKIIAIAVLAIPAALANAQSNNPEDSDYRGPVAQEITISGTAPAAVHATTSAKFRVVLNPEDSGYFGRVAQEDSGIVPAALHATASAKFRVVTNPEDSGYRGPVAEENATDMTAGVAGSSLAQRMGQ